jgi:ATP-binding cassette subfamily G (WHITE) protein 2 (PDR)
MPDTDEPTSGLDSQIAWAICNLLCRLANHGQTIVCSLQQPSAKILFEFDNVLLLGPEGKTHYFSRLQDMVSYFEEFGAEPCAARSNPADWVLNITQCDSTTKPKIDWASLWNNSPQRQNALQYMETLKAPEPKSLQGYRGSIDEFAASSLKQLQHVTARLFRSYWRSPSYVWSRFFLTVGSVSV